MPTLLEKKAGELDEVVSIVRDIQDKAAKEDRDLTDVETDRIRALGEMVEKLKGECSFLNDQVVSERAWSKLRSDIEANQLAHDETVNRRPGMQQRAGAVDVHGQNWGEAFIGSDAFRNYVGGGTSQRVSVPLNLDRRAEITLGDVPQQPMLWMPPQYSYVTPLLDKVGKVTTGSNAVSWVEWTPNPMAAATVVAEGALKPEAVMDATPESGTLQTYATWKGITRQALEDVPQIRSIVENRLRQSVLVALENAVVASLIAATIPAVSGSTMLGSIRAGIATVQAAGFAQPNAIIINPADAADIDAALMAGTLNGAVVNGTYWGVPVVPTNHVVPGTAYVGDFSVGTTLFNRGQTDVYLTDSHADYFIRNILLLLAETRALSTVPEPAALAECTVVTIP
jgi:hypothetical protein